MLTKSYDTAPDGQRFRVRYVVRNERGEIEGVGTALTERFTTLDAAEAKAAAMNHLPSVRRSL